MLDLSVLQRPGTVLFDPSRPGASSQREALCFTAPRCVLTATTPADLPGLLRQLGAATDRGLYVAGYLSYEAGYSFVDLDTPGVPERPDAPDGERVPLAWFGVYDAPQRLAPPDVDTAFDACEAPARVSGARFDVPRRDYVDRLQTVRHHIREGDVYQVNVTGPVRFRLNGSPGGLYRDLRSRQHVGYGAYLHTGVRRILSVSPELFFERNGSRLTTRPMKGTIRRGRTLEEDQALQDDLASDPKNRAENLMIVDLLRNDLSVCCKPGSVRVPALYETETYDTVTQMTSTVRGTLQDGAGLADVFRALFPCGSITGAPKRRAMQVIRDVETDPRDVYCGAIGYAGPDDTALFNVAIRTAVLTPTSPETSVGDAEGDAGTYDGVLGIGSGVVWDSDPDAEYEECRLKAQFLTGDALPVSGEEDEGEEGGDVPGERPVVPGDGLADQADRVSILTHPGATSRDETQFRLIETMRFDGVMIPLLDRHLARLEASATYFGMSFDEAYVRNCVDAVLAGRDLEERLLVRLMMNRWGKVSLTTRPLPEPIDEPWRCIIASERVDASNRYLYHKTTRRDVYDRARDEAEAEGADEALLFNQEGHLTEGAISNVFVQEGDRYWTPPVECGLLGGVYRAHVLDTVDASGERVLTLDDLRSADAVFCCNAVRGWRRAVLDEKAK